MWPRRGKFFEIGVSFSSFFLALCPIFLFVFPYIFFVQFFCSLSNIFSGSQDRTWDRKSLGNFTQFHLGSPLISRDPEDSNAMGNTYKQHLRRKQGLLRFFLSGLCLLRFLIVLLGVANFTIGCNICLPYVIT